MNRNSIRAGFVLAAMASSLAVAQEGTQEFQNPPPSMRTRAAVIAELEQARARGELEQRGESYGSFDPAAIASTRSRAEVLAELEAARRARALDAGQRSAVYGSFPAGEIASSRSRDAVRAEVVAAQKVHGALSRGERGGE